MWRKEMIASSRSSWSLKIFSLSLTKKTHSKQCGEYAYWCHGSNVLSRSQSWYHYRNWGFFKSTFTYIAYTLLEEIFCNFMILLLFIPQLSFPSFFFFLARQVKTFHELQNIWNYFRKYRYTFASKSVFCFWHKSSIVLKIIQAKEKTQVNIKSSPNNEVLQKTRRGFFSSLFLFIHDEILI